MRPETTRSRSAIGLAVLLFAGCAASPPERDSDGMRRVAFECDLGEHVEMRFFPA